MTAAPRAPGFVDNASHAGGRLMDNLSRTARLLLWDYARGSLPYDLLCVILLLLMILIPPALLGDPMAARP